MTTKEKRSVNADIRRLLTVALQAVDYVGYANFPERIHAAGVELERAHKAALDGKLHEFKFTPRA